ALQLGDGGRIGLDVDGIELDPPRRQQLLRLGAGRSAGTVEDARLHGQLPPANRVPRSRFSGRGTSAPVSSPRTRSRRRGSPRCGRRRRSPAPPPPSASPGSPTSIGGAG